MASGTGERTFGRRADSLDHDDAALRRLRTLNVAAGIAHLAQGILILLLSTDFALPVTAAFLELRGDALEPVPRELFSLQIGIAVAAFSFLSAAAHATVAGPAYGFYVTKLRAGINPVRWVEYSFSASLMIVVIAMLSGVYEVAALIGLFGLNAMMILFGWLMELGNEAGARPSWLPFGFGCIAGALPWVAIGIYLVGAGSEGGGPPGFVYGIYGSLFVFFNVFAINMVLQYRARGRWADYLFGERVYILLSFAAKSALAWQVFAGTLRPA